MKNIKSINSFPKQIFRLKDLFGGIITEDYGIYTLEFNNTIGNGIVKHYSLNEGSTVLDFNVTLNEDIVYKIGENESNLLFFAYCTEGNTYFKSPKNEKYIKIEELRPSIIGAFKNEKNQINIKKDIKFIFNLITIDKDNYFNKFCKNPIEKTIQLDQLLRAFEALESKVFKSSYNLKIADFLRHANTIKIDNSIANVLKIESNYQHILALHIDQFYTEMFDEHSVATLSKFELQKIRQITEHIISNPEVQHSISSLCSKITMSPAKLQEGFKGMHDTTVADFVRNVRIDKAEKLLAETDLNISEIVYSIGLTSRSYFCKIFKSKYNCSPKRYRKIIRSKPVT